LLGCVGQQVFELSACSVIATSDRAWSLAEDRGCLRLVETVPVHEADDLGVEGVESFERGSDVECCVEVVRLVAFGELVAQSLAQRRSARVPAAVFGEHPGGDAAHPHACLRVVAWDVLNTSPQDKQGVSEQVRGVLGLVNSSGEEGQHVARLGAYQVRRPVAVIRGHRLVPQAACRTVSYR